MPTITRITEQRRQRKRRNVFLDGHFAFGCHLNVVARFRLREGLSISDQQVQAIKYGEVKQECFDTALRLLTLRLHSVAQVRRKLARKQWGEDVIEATIEELVRLGYLDDERFARTQAMAALHHKQHGPRRAMLELLKAGVNRDAASRAIEDVYGSTDNIAVARELARKRSDRLRKLEPTVARRRLAGLLQRRGFEYGTIREIIEQMLGEMKAE